MSIQEVRAQESQRHSPGQLTCSIFAATCLAAQPPAATIPAGIVTSPRKLNSPLLMRCDSRAACSLELVYRLVTARLARSSAAGLLDARPITTRNRLAA
jgi:hypothetical protein